MNLLLLQLQRAGVMKSGAIAFARADAAIGLASFLDRHVLCMPDGTRPGPYWVVKPDDSGRAVAHDSKITLYFDGTKK